MPRRLKYSFSAGELSPLMESRLDFKKHANGCSKLQNMVCTTQGPVTRRPGFEYLANLTTELALSTNYDPQFRMEEFIFNEDQSYVMIFYYDDAGLSKAVIAFGNGLLRENSKVIVGTQVVPVPYHPTYVYKGLGIDTADSYSVSLKPDVWSGAIRPMPVSDYTVDTTIPNQVTITVTETSWVEFPGTAVVLLATNSPSSALVQITDLPTDWEIAKLDFAQSADVVYVAQPNKEPATIERTGHTAWAVDISPLTSFPQNSVPADLWSDALGWPESVTFHQQRLAFGGSLSQRQTIWLSGAGDFDNMGVPTEPDAQPSDPFSFTIDSGTQNRILWLHSARVLQVGTIGNEWTVTSAAGAGAPLTAGNVTTQRQTNIGSVKLKPQMIGISTLYLERYGRRIQEFVYDFNSDSYKSTDMSVLSTHITDASPIVDWAYQQSPDGIIWCVRRDGTLLGLTFQRAHEVIGWHVHETGSYVGQVSDDAYLKDPIQAIASIPGFREDDEIWVIVKRNTASGAIPFYTLERMGSKFRYLETMGAFLDSFYEYRGSAIDTIDLLALGFEHYDAGAVLHIIADGVFYTELNAPGSPIVLPVAAEHIYVGHPVVAEVWPTLKDVETRSGTAKGSMQRISTLDIDLYKSGQFNIGRYDREDGESVDFAPMREIWDETNAAVPLFTGVYHYDFSEGFDRDSRYFLKQVEPFPFTVRAVTDTVEIGDD